MLTGAVDPEPCYLNFTCKILASDQFVNLSVLIKILMFGIRKKLNVGLFKDILVVNIRNELPM